MAEYRKFIVAVVTAVLAWASAVVLSTDGPITASEWLALAVGVAGALGVYAVRNEPV